MLDWCSFWSKKSVTLSTQKMPKERGSSQYKQYELPQATVNRLIKEVCSPKINVGKNAKSAISKSAAVFILYLAWKFSNIYYYFYPCTIT